MFNLADLIMSVAPANLLPVYLTQYIRPLTPMSTTPAVVGALVGYLTTIFGLQYLMTSRPPMKLNFLFQAYLGISSNVVMPGQREERKSVGVET